MSSMRLAVLGASGHTGKCVVEQALDRGDDVVALARHATSLPRSHRRLSKRDVDVLDGPGLTDALADVEAVVSTLGVGTTRRETVTCSEGTRNTLAAMSAHEIPILVVTSAAPAGPRGEQPRFERRVLMPILDRFFGASYRDMRRMEHELASSDVSWVALRPPRLSGGPAAGRYRVAREPLKGARSLSFADLAAALLAAVAREDLHGNAWYVAR
jgi:putative NADH-flavin reductase